jgi:hypothetical protein
MASLLRKAKAKINAIVSGDGSAGSAAASSSGKGASGRHEGE